MPISKRFSERSTNSRFSQFSNAAVPMYSMLEGIFIDLSEEQYANTSLGRSLIPLGSTIVYNPLHP